MLIVYQAPSPDPTEIPEPVPCLEGWHGLQRAEPGDARSLISFEMSI